MSALGMSKIFPPILVKGFTIMVVPNSSPGKIKSCMIPFVITLLILGIALFNLLVVVAYSTQVWTIYQCRLTIAEKQNRIAKLETSRKQILSDMRQSRQTEKELIRLEKEQLRLLTLWKQIQQKGGVSPETASRGASLRYQPYPANAPKPGDDIAQARQKLRRNLSCINQYITMESQAQTDLMKELKAYDVRLDYTPSIWPVCTGIVCGFGLRMHPIWKRLIEHKGVDIQAASGTPVRAAADGIVRFAGWEDGYGNLVAINHGYGFETRYGHNSRLRVRPGQRVKKGQIISYSGNTGVSTGPHLHYEIRMNGNPVNPVSYLRN